MTKTCETCGYTFKRGDVINEVIEDDEVTYMCEMCRLQLPPVPSLKPIKVVEISDPHNIEGFVIEDDTLYDLYVNDAVVKMCIDGAVKKNMTVIEMLITMVSVLVDSKNQMISSWVNATMNKTTVESIFVKDSDKNEC